MAIIASKPPTHPLFQSYKQARETKLHTHKSPIHAFFQSKQAKSFGHFLDLQQPDSKIPLPNTIIIQEKDKAIKSIQDLRPSATQIIVYSDGSRIQGKNTAAVVWCENNKHSSTHQLGNKTDHGIFEAYFAGLNLALQLAKQFFLITTRQITLVLDNQGVVKDMANKKTSSWALNKKIEAINTIKEIEDIAPHFKLALRWWTGSKGVRGLLNLE